MSNRKELYTFNDNPSPNHYNPKFYIVTKNNFNGNIIYKLFILQQKQLIIETKYINSI